MSPDYEYSVVSQPAALAFNPHPQDASLLFQRMPQELRDKIYAYTFSAARLASGTSCTLGSHRLAHKTGRNVLALLKTCRRAHIEIGDRWISQVLFWYGDSATMLAKLSAVPPEIIPKIRHVLLRTDSVNPTCPFLAGSIGLRLDTFTLLGDRHLHTSVHYATLDLLVREGCGWKELHFLCESRVLGFSPNTLLQDLIVVRPSHRRPQPVHWQEALESRDGAPSRPSVAVFRATDLHLHASNPDTREPFAQAVPEDPEAQESFGKTADATLMAGPAEKFKEMLVVIKRGDGVDYTQRGVQTQRLEDGMNFLRFGTFHAGYNRTAETLEDPDAYGWEWH